MNPMLANYTTAELETEIAQRRYAKEDDPPIKHCDECAHFIRLKTDEPMRLDFNPCSKGHHMRFQMPNSPLDLNWGFYRRNCRDRQPSTVKASHD